MPLWTIEQARRGSGIAVREEASQVHSAIAPNSTDFAPVSSGSFTTIRRSGFAILRKFANPRFLGWNAAARWWPAARSKGVPRRPTSTYRGSWIRRRNPPAATTARRPPQAPRKEVAARSRASSQGGRARGSRITSRRLGERWAGERWPVRYTTTVHSGGLRGSGGRVLGIVRPRRDNRKTPSAGRHTARKGWGSALLARRSALRQRAFHDSTGWPDARCRTSQSVRSAGSESIKSATVPRPRSPQCTAEPPHADHGQAAGTSGNVSPTEEICCHATASRDCAKRGAVRGRPPPGGWAGAVGVRLRGGRAEPTR
ncbi:MAG: hypothetical protein QOI35_40 [Cryptosporangiaceae bacterium]|nr:hypothetical protein [Cryptosporangiaceae bacterium]